MRASGSGVTGMVFQTGPGAELAVLAGGGPGASAVVSSSKEAASVLEAPGANYRVVSLV